ncbi:MAG: ribosome-associated translation inhibitor RaiA [Clostridia bacterium]|nr:ribosome-associated translation inhibitor RaiA [Clostridia bacterium]
MKIDIIQKNYSMSEKLEEIIRKKLAKLDKYFDEGTVVKVVLKKENNVYKMEITANVGGNFIRAELAGENMYDNIDILLPKIERQVLKHKSKLQDKLQKNAFHDGFVYVEEAPKEEHSSVVRVKRFDLKPMSVEDAIDAMEMLSHDFYVYQDEETNQLRIVYLREDGTVGLIEPIVS